jgi:nitroreductase
VEKPAPVDHTVHELIQRRWSPRSFDDRPIEDPVLRRMLEAARWAPSCYNDQPWTFIVGRKDTETYDLLFDCLYEGNQEWADEAPLLMLSVARTNFQHNGEPNRHALHDVGLAVENMVLQALDEDVFVHQMAGFDGERAREVFSIPGDHEPVAALAAGYSANPERTDEENGEERSRKSLEEFVYGDSWGETASFLE